MVREVSCFPLSLVAFVYKCFGCFFPGLTRLGPIWNWLGPGEAEVTDLDLAVSINENVGRLDVSVHYVGGMQEVKGAEEVV